MRRPTLIRVGMAITTVPVAADFARDVSWPLTDGSMVKLTLLCAQLAGIVLGRQEGTKVGAEGERLNQLAGREWEQAEAERRRAARPLQAQDRG